MVKGVIQILDLDFEYKLWKNRLNSYLREIDLLKDRINVLKREQHNFKVSEGVGGVFENQKVSLEGLMNKIFTLEQEIAHFAEDYPISEDHMHYINHELIRVEVEKVSERQSEIMISIYPELCYPNHANEPIR